MLTQWRHDVATNHFCPSDIFHAAPCGHTRTKSLFGGAGRGGGGLGSDFGSNYFCLNDINHAMILNCYRLNSHTKISTFNWTILHSLTNHCTPPYNFKIQRSTQPKPHSLAFLISFGDNCCLNIDCK